jgi:succinate-semialdehyde dehydrogenase/glutarate-semialdehyde dehydrogenase
MTKKDMISPSTGEKLGSVELDSSESVEKKLQRAFLASQNLRESSVSERAYHMRKSANIMRESKDELCALMAKEMGKPVLEGDQEVDACVQIMQYYASHAQEFLNPESVQVDSKDVHRAYVRLPRGLVTVTVVCSMLI